MPKFIQSLDNQVYTQLEKLAKERGITVQTLIRAVIVPEWTTVSGADVRHEKATVIEPDRSSYHPSPALPQPAHRAESDHQQQLPSSTILHLRHLKPSSFYGEEKEEEKTEKGMIVYGRKRRHH